MRRQSKSRRRAGSSAPADAQDLTNHERRSKLRVMLLPAETEDRTARERLVDLLARLLFEDEK